MSGDTVNLYNPHEGLTGRDGGPYLDQVEREAAEKLRARVEQREPDYANAPATAGTPLVDANTLVGMANPASNPSKSATVDAMTNAVELLAENEEFPATPVAQRDKTDDEKEAAKHAADGTTPYNPASPTVVSTDEDNSDAVSKSAGTTPKENTAKKAAATKQTSAKSSTTKKAAAKSTAASK